MIIVHIKTAVLALIWLSRMSSLAMEGPSHQMVTSMGLVSISRVCSIALFPSMACIGVEEALRFGLTEVITHVAIQTLPLVHSYTRAKRLILAEAMLDLQFADSFALVYALVVGFVVSQSRIIPQSKNGHSGTTDIQN